MKVSSANSGGSNFVIEAATMEPIGSGGGLGSEETRGDDQLDGEIQWLHKQTSELNIDFPHVEFRVLWR